jgi:hypothetical protein
MRHYFSGLKNKGLQVKKIALKKAGEPKVGHFAPFGKNAQGGSRR